MARKAKETPHLRLRVEKSLLARLEKSAEKDARTLTGEIVHRLQQSYETDDRIDIFREAMEKRIEESKQRSLERLATVQKEVEEARASAVESARRVEELTTEMGQLEQMSKEAIRAEAVVNVLLGLDQLKSELLRSIALELAEAPSDWLNNVSSRRQMADHIVSRFETGIVGPIDQGKAAL